MEGAEILTKFTAEDDGTEKQVEKITKKLEELVRQGEKSFKIMTGVVDAFTVAVLKGGIEYDAQMETLQVRLETLTGSAEEASKVMDQIKKDAISTPFDVSSLTQAESLLLATGVSSDEARENILALGNAVSASGGGNAELQRMAVNLQQIKNVGKASSLDIKQFAYAGIDIYGLLADSMGVTREEASQLDVTYEMLTKALQKASKQGGKYYGAMEKQSKTYAGATSNLKESFEVLKGELAQGVFEAIKNLIPKLTELFDWLTKNKDIIVAIAIPVLTFINVMAGLLIVEKLSLSFAKFFLVLYAHPFVTVLAGVTALVAGFTYLWKHCETFRNFWIQLWEDLKNGFDLAIYGIKNGINNVISGFTQFLNGIQNLKNNVVGAFNKLGDGVKRVFTGIRDVIVNTFQAIGNLIKAPINAIIDAINKVLDSINSIQVPDWVPGIGGKHTNFKHIKKLATGTNYVPQDMIAMIHEGEAVVPKKFNPYANGISHNTIASMGNSQNIIVNISNNMEFDSLGQLVNNVKTFSGGAKNDYNYGMGG